MGFNIGFILLQAAAATETSSSFFDSPWWKFATLMARAMVVGLWLALVFWTYKDAKRRLSDNLLVGVAVATSLIFPYIGTLFYIILRPPEYLDDVLERDLEIQAREKELGGESRCPACSTPVRDNFLVCPQCRRKLKAKCAACGKPLNQSWRVCPYCETDIGGGKAKSRNRAVVTEEDELFA